MPYPNTTASSSSVIPFPTAAATGPSREREAPRRFLRLLNPGRHGLTFQTFTEKKSNQDVA